MKRYAQGSERPPPIAPSRITAGSAFNYDGQRFLTVMEVDQGVTMTPTIIVNWAAGLAED